MHFDASGELGAFAAAFAKEADAVLAGGERERTSGGSGSGSGSDAKAAAAVANNLAWARWADSQVSVILFSF